MWLTDRQDHARGTAAVERLDLLTGIAANQHGVGSSRAEGERPRDRDAPGAPLARKRFRLRVLSRLLLVALVAAWGVVLLVS